MFASEDLNMINTDITNPTRLKVAYLSSDNDDIRCSIIANPNCPASVTELGACDDSAKVRAAAIESGKLSAETLAKLSEDFDPDVANLAVASLCCLGR